MAKLKVLADGRVMTEEELSHEARVQMALNELDLRAANRTRVHNTPKPGTQSPSGRDGGQVPNPSILVEVEVGEKEEPKLDRRRDAAAPQRLGPSEPGQSRLGSVIFGRGVK
jgi:hypothetical protein